MNNNNNDKNSKATNAENHALPTTLARRAQTRHALRGARCGLNTELQWLCWIQRNYGMYAPVSTRTSSTSSTTEIASLGCSETHPVNPEGLHLPVQASLAVVAIIRNKVHRMVYFAVDTVLSIILCEEINCHTMVETVVTRLLPQLFCKV